MSEEGYFPRGCGICKGTGWMSFPAEKDAQGRFHLRPGSRYKAVIPCRCVFGDERWSEHHRTTWGFDPDLRLEVFSWRREQIASAPPIEESRRRLAEMGLLRMQEGAVAIDVHPARKADPLPAWLTDSVATRVDDVPF